MLIKHLVKKYEQKFQKSGLHNSLYDIDYILSECLKINRNSIFFIQNTTIKDKKKKHIERLLKKRLARIPVQRIFKKVYFRDFELKLNRYNFIPRIDSELIIDILDDIGIRPKKILDLGTGSGALIISMLRHFKTAKGIGTDISYESIYMAKKNAIINNVENKVSFICCDWLKVFAEIDFDLIVSNPPYIETRIIESLQPEVKDHDPKIALDGGIDGLNAYREILSGLEVVAKKPFILLFEIGYDQAEKVSRLMKEKELKDIKVFDDCNRINRFIIGLKE